VGHTGEFELLVPLVVRRLEDDAYGVTILRELERQTSRTLTLGTVYKTLGRLAAEGHLRSRMAPPTRGRGGRPKKLYALTPVGRAATRRSLIDLRQMAAGLEPDLGVP
jgi:PadR family transcriptional regulator PadR